MIILQIWNVSINQLVKSGNLYFIIASLCWAVMTILSKKTQKSVHFIVFSFYVYGIASLILLFPALSTGSLIIKNISLEFFLNYFVSAILSTFYAMTVYFYASGKISSRKVTSFMFAVPICALFFCWVILGENPELTTIIGGCISIIAVYIIQSSKRVKT